MAKLGSLFSAVFRLSVCLLQYVVLSFSLGLSTFLLGKYTMRGIHQRKELVELVYWRDLKKSGAVLGALFAVLYLFQQYSVLGIFIYSSLLGLLATLGFRVFKLAEASFKKQPDAGNPYQRYLDIELSVPTDKLHQYVDLAVEHVVFLFKKLRHIYLAENLLDSIKFGLFLYSLTYVVSWFSGLGLIVLFIIAVFALPKTYELYKEPIDGYVKLAKEQLEQLSNLAQEKLPFLKTPSAEKKEE